MLNPLLRNTNMPAHDRAGILLHITLARSAAAGKQFPKIPVGISSAVIVIFVTAAFFACSKSSNPAASAPPQSPPPSFTFHVGSSFLYEEWLLDSNDVRSNPQFVHETFVDSDYSIGGFNNAYVALDSIFDATNTILQSIDTAYFNTNGTVVSEYNFISLLMQYYPFPGKMTNYTGGGQWYMLQNIGSATNWQDDSCSFQTDTMIKLNAHDSQNFTYPFTESLKGENVFDSILIANGDTVNVNFAILNGSFEDESVPQHITGIFFYVV